MRIAALQGAVQAYNAHMITIYRTDETTNALTQLEEIQPGCWVSVVAPTAEDRGWLEGALNIEPEFITAMFDDEERSHVDYDEDSRHTLVILDCPCVEDKDDKVAADTTQYDTHPFSALFLPEHQVIVTVALQENATVTYFQAGRSRELKTQQRTQMLLLMMLHVSQSYQTNLRIIDRQFKKNEQKLRASMRNLEMIRMLGLEKSLIYFSISLRAMEATLAKIGAGKYIKMFEEDKDLLDDVRIEFRQASEMCEISSKLLNETMDTFSNIINNSMNDAMKRLTIITLVLAVPTIVFSFYGMNVDNLPFIDSWVWAMLISLVLCVSAGIIFVKCRFFR